MSPWGCSYIFWKLGQCTVHQLFVSCNPPSLVRIRWDVSPILSPCVLYLPSALYLLLYLCTPHIVTWPPPDSSSRLLLISKLPTSGTFCMHSGIFCIHSGTFCMHSGTFCMTNVMSVTDFELEHSRMHIKSSKIYSCLILSSTNLFHQQTLQLLFCSRLNTNYTLQ